jgi:hypothetical protein
VAQTETGPLPWTNYDDVYKDSLDLRGPFADDWNKELARIRGVPAGAPPAYADNQAEQWPRSIEI